ncbi:hypothetical protein ACFWY9_12420 [Amycolatopsis sp. NPDC059027]|uniref:hypothetical protein n=1 Tax=unclassified Amycolatopsis TaxID=2618356 RepID=UPI00366AA7AE
MNVTGKGTDGLEIAARVMAAQQLHQQLAAEAERQQPDRAEENIGDQLERRP